ncbi:organ-specific protein P4 [Ricinus communis]|uniref:organ-specific protein P4 n=1 Tax=Ricinus communis TaxID=3988 RepID=UPI00201A2520|nr:organ-specific protein P4 [Ricinus communis]
MKMNSSFPFIALFLFVLVTSTTDARKDVGEYWPRGVMKDQPLPEVAASSKINCHTTDDSELKNFVKEFKDPDETINHNDIKPGQSKSFFKNFEPVPNLSVYNNDSILKEKKSFFVKDFEPRPDASVYDNDVGLKEDKSFAEDFEAIPNL